MITILLIDHERNIVIVNYQNRRFFTSISTLTKFNIDYSKVETIHSNKSIQQLEA
jgi:hypothetical protein